MSILISHPNYAQEIAKHFSVPIEMLAVLLTCKEICRVWKPYYKQLISMQKLLNSVFAEHYFPENMCVFTHIKNLQLPDVVHFAGRKIGEIETEKYYWSTSYIIRVFLPKTSESIKRAVCRGCQFRIAGFRENENGSVAVVTTTKNKLEAINICKAVYCYFMKH
jgi:hypothetical protein